MRFPEVKIKEAILHPDLEIRERATDYFNASFADDASIMGQVIKAVETYDRHGAFRLIGSSRNLRQTEKSVAWIISELNEEQTANHENYIYNLWTVLVHADPFLLLPKEAAISEVRHARPDLHLAIHERLRMLAWDEATCWRELERMCREDENALEVDRFDHDRALRLVEALARHGKGCEEKVHAVLELRVDVANEDTISWMELLVVRLAGLTQLESTIPLIVTKLQEDRGDFLDEECSEALVRIGNSAVVHAVAAAYPTATGHFRHYSIEPLERIHSDLAVEKCVDLLAQEKDDGIRERLAEALLTQFAQEGIEAARQVLAGRELGFSGKGLRHHLLQTCSFTGERFPEYDEWLAAEKNEKEENRRRLAELKNNPAGQLRFALEKLTGVKLLAVPKAKPALPPMTLRMPSSKPAANQRAGRNDRCPCGSGKKFKKCCGRS